jgi:HK97 family phage prohead protease
VTDIDGTIFIDGNKTNDGLLSYLDSFPDTSVFVVTGRLEADRERTSNELTDAGVRFDDLIMRPDESLTSNEFKAETAVRLMETYNVMVAVDNDEGARAAYRAAGITALHPNEVPASRAEARAVDLTPPAYMVDAARKGLEWFAEGLAGDGLTGRTVREARDMVAGQVSEDKWVRIAAWISRHLVDLDSPDANPDSNDYPSAGVVAHALWGSDGGKAGARRVLSYAEDIIGRIEAENTNRSKVTMSKIETRLFVNDFEVRETADGMTLTGYAARFNEPSEPLPFLERIAPGAFKRSLRAKNDIKLLWNHDSSMVLGSTRSGTLRLSEDDKGLFVDAILPDTQAGRDAKVLIQRGDVTGFSFGFTVPPNGDSWNSEGTERTLKSVRLLEVSTGVAFPAYPSTNGTAQVRSLEDVVMAVGVDYDALSMVLGKVAAGEPITYAEKEVMELVLDALVPEEEAPVEDAPMDEAMTEQNGLDQLALHRKKLALMELLETL